MEQMQGNQKKNLLYKQNEVIRYVLVGIAATTIHYGVFLFSLKVMLLTSAVSNFFGAVLGIVASFLGSRYYVFKSLNEFWLIQFSKFSSLYVSIAFVNSGIVYVVIDILSFHYNIGFLVGIFFQVLFSFLGNKLVVFKT